MHGIDIHWAFVTAYVPVALLSGYLIMQMAQALVERLRHFEVIHQPQTKPPQIKQPQPVAEPIVYR